MSIIKNSSCPESKMVVSKRVCVCNSCGHTQIAEGTSAQKCPKCDSDMSMISSNGDEEFLN